MNLMGMVLRKAREAVTTAVEGRTLYMLEFIHAYDEGRAESGGLTVEGVFFSREEAEAAVNEGFRWFEGGECVGRIAAHTRYWEGDVPPVLWMFDNGSVETEHYKVLELSDERLANRIKF